MSGININDSTRIPIVQDAKALTESGQRANMKKTTNPAKLACAFILHILGVIAYFFIYRLFKNYDKNKTLIYKIDKLNDAIYKIEWHLEYYIKK